MKDSSVWTAAPNHLPAAICRSSERFAASIFSSGVLDRPRINDPSVGGPSHDPGWGFPSHNSEGVSAMDDPFMQTRERRVRADRYQKMASEYFEMAKSTTSPSLRASYQHTAEEYRVRAEGELRLIERGDASAADQLRAE
jgi:hypothetical protein